MIREHHPVVIAGAGGIGRAVALLLGEWASFDVEIWIGDAREEAARDAVEWVRHGLSHAVPVHAFHLPAEGVNPEFTHALSQGHLLLDCLPGSQAPRLARLAREHRLHYANLTEYVQETLDVQAIAAGASEGFLLQTGLAPGFVNVLAHRLFQEFCQQHGVTRVQSVQMRVGALPENALEPHFYGFTWSTVGVATEYIKDAIVVRDGARTTRPSLTEIESVQIGDLRLEAALTSGGAADLPDALLGRVDHLDYKTFRHPGHYAYVAGLRAGLAPGEDPISALEAAMLRDIPEVEHDQVAIYAAVEGLDARGRRHRKEESLVVGPLKVGGQTLKAIQSTTAAGLAESARLLLSGRYAGVVLQSQIDPWDYLGGGFIRQAYYGAPGSARPKR